MSLFECTQTEDLLLLVLVDSVVLSEFVRVYCQGMLALKHLHDRDQLADALLHCDQARGLYAIRMLLVLLFGSVITLKMSGQFSYKLFGSAAFDKEDGVFFL